MNIDFSKSGGLVPVIVQDVHSRRVLMLGYMNAEAFEQTRSTSRVTFFSRSKNRLWVKGETSGNFMTVSSIHIDCDSDTLLILAEPAGPVCHTGSQDCFNQPDDASGFIHELDAIISARAEENAEHSYTAKLLAKGIQKIAQKVGEEAVETILEAQSGSDDLLLNESADLLYHLLVMLKARGLSLKDVESVLKARHKG